jgi:hypothetical protein
MSYLGECDGDARISSWWWLVYARHTFCPVVVGYRKRLGANDEFLLAVQSTLLVQGVVNRSGEAQCDLLFLWVGLRRQELEGRRNSREPVIWKYGLRGWPVKVTFALCSILPYIIKCISSLVQRRPPSRPTSAFDNSDWEHEKIGHWCLLYHEAERDFCGVELSF